mmetsp:Transcript_18988/g.53943  ORF Transcript_18988/g.53943 Transcript_18988/m.53943 type:complete len:116 (+) Transcript_18988:1226-1573(+)
MRYDTIRCEYICGIASGITSTQAFSTAATHPSIHLQHTCMFATKKAKSETSSTPNIRTSTRGQTRRKQHYNLKHSPFKYHADEWNNSETHTHTYTQNTESACRGFWPPTNYASNI